MMDIVAQLAALLGGPNGVQAAAELDAAGVPPPSKAMLLGGPKPETDPIAAAAADVSMGRGGTPTAPVAPAATAGPDLTKLGLAAAQGLKTPEPIKPIMSGGVTGGVKAPDAQMQAGAGTQALQALLAALGPGQAGKDPLRVPTLGMIMGGRR